MKTYNKLFAGILLFLLLLCGVANAILLTQINDNGARPYLVEINRIAKEIEQNGISKIDLSTYTYVTNIEQYNENNSMFWEDTGSDYCVRQINHSVYRFDYISSSKTAKLHTVILLNSILGIMMLTITIILLWVRQKILTPFRQLRNVPYELSKGNLTTPIKENRSKFFGKFVWGINMLRENMEVQKEKEMNLQRDKKTLILSISHDIKTPLLAIKLYAKSLSRRLYTDEAKQIEIAEHINEKADEIEDFVSQIIKASNEDFLNLEVAVSEFYLSELMDKITVFYKEKLGILKTDFTVEKYSNCILKGDLDRSIEVLQNIMENAIKYGDGSKIQLTFSDEEDCQLITVKNSGCTLAESELPHIFESFWRGSNTGSNNGSGLGLYICRQLMHKMNGEIFAEIQEDLMCITTVFPKAI